jgi:putative mRNA 3-end processing factor
MVRWLRQIGLDAKAFETEYGDEDDNAEGSAAPEEGEAHAKPNAASNAAEEANDA